MTAINFRYQPLFGEEAVSQEPGHVVWRYQVKREHFNPAGALHGGVLATLLDTVMGHAVRTVRPPDRVHAAINLDVRFLGATLSDGGSITFEGRVVQLGKRIAFAESVARDENGREL